MPGQRKDGLTYDNSPISGHMLNAFFNTDGTNNPAAPAGFSNTIQSVTRVTLDTSNVPAYRVRFRDSFPFSVPGAVVNDFYSVRGLAGATVDDLRAIRVMNGTVGGVAAIPDLEIDIVVHNEAETGGAKAGPTNSVGAGRRVSIFVLFDLG